MFTEQVFWKYDSAKKNIDIAGFRGRHRSTKGATVANNRRGNASIGVSKMYAKRALRDATSLMKVFFSQVFI